MADFILCRGPASARLARRLQGRLAAAGLSFTLLMEESAYTLLWRTGAEAPQESFWQQVADSWILRSGLFSHRAKAGAAGLAAFLEAFDEAAPGLAETRGQFCLVFKKAERLYLSCDALGTNKIYHNQDQTLFSNLFIAAAEGLANPGLDLQGCYEYVWNGVPSGQRSFFSDLLTLPPANFLMIAPRQPPRLLSLPALALAEDRAAPGETMAAAAGRHLGRLRRLIAGYREAFGDRVNLLFSGGYDSRLLLGLLLEAGLRPRITVYGGAGDRDCRIARQVAEGEGLAFRRVDKSRGPPRAPENPGEELDPGEELLRNYAAFDGWKVTGLFDNGADRADRRAQVADGAAKMNGSLGEIYRNFFYLPDRPYKARDLIWSFYGRNDPRACTARFDLVAYEAELAGALAEAVGARGPWLTRRQVELAYPLFRGRYWTARDVPINQGFGPYLTPFMEPAVIKGTCDLKIAWKSHGRFEGEMIRQLSGRLAAYPSVYGHGFDRPPPLAVVLRAQASYRRPAFVRRFSYRLRQGRPSPRPSYLAPERLAAVMDPAFPYMRALFRLERIHDEEVLNRIATLEFLCQRYQAREP